MVSQSSHTHSFSTMEVECEWIVFPGGQHEKGPFYVTVRDSAIAGISSEPSAPQGGSDLQQLSTHLLVPGFVDLHTHGVGECTSNRVLIIQG